MSCRPSFDLPVRLSLFAGIVVLAACGSGDGQQQQGMFGGPVPVAAITVQPQAVPVNLEYAARTLGSREVEVRARVTGILMKRNYEEGSRVKAGQSLFAIDPAPFEAALARAEADVAAAEARHLQAKREAARLKPLQEVKAVSQKEAEDASSAEAVAAADLQAARARLREARLNLQWTRVEAPIAGVASRSLRSEGSLVSGPDVLLTTVTQTDPMYVLFGVADNERLRLQQEVQAGRLRWPKDGHFQVTVRLADGSDYKHAGVVNFADVRVSPDTGTSEGRATIPNPEDWLRAGEFVRVRLTGAVREAAFKVPQRAVLEGPQGKFVYTVGKDGKAEMKKVEVGEWTDGDIVVHAGLNPGDQVIVDGVLKLGPGAPVQVAPPGQPGAAPAAPGQAPAAAAPAKSGS